MAAADAIHATAIAQTPNEAMNSAVLLEPLEKSTQIYHDLLLGLLNCALAGLPLAKCHQSCILPRSVVSNGSVQRT